MTGQIASKLTTNSQCTHWVSNPSPQCYLYGELEEEVYMVVPEGLGGVPDGDVLKLNKALYGLKQAGCQWYLRLKDVMKKFGMELIPSGPHTFIARKKVKG